MMIVFSLSLVNTSARQLYKIRKWDDIKQGAKKNEGYKDGFTVIDLENKIAYKGEDLYRYAYEQNQTLDGDVYKRQHQYKPQIKKKKLAKLKVLVLFTPMMK